MTAQIVSIRRTFSAADVQRAMSTTLATVAAEVATGVQARQLVTMACAYADICVALGIIVPAAVAELIDR